MCGRDAKDAGRDRLHVGPVRSLQNWAKIWMPCSQRPSYATGRSTILPNSGRFDARQHATVKPCLSGADREVSRKCGGSGDCELQA